jgi:hypothetical protein
VKMEVASGTGFLRHRSHIHLAVDCPGEVTS